MTKMISNLQAHLASIVEASNDAIISKAMDGVITYWNKGAEQIFGYSSEEMLGKTINTLAPEGMDEHQTILDKYNRGEKLENFETQRVKKDGSIINASLTVSPIFDDEKKTVGFSVIARDITKNIIERKKAENKFKGLLESAPDAMVIVNSEGKIQLINSQAEKLFGYKRDEICGQKVEVLIPMRYAHGHVEHRKNFFANPKVRSMGAGLDLFGQNKNGTEFPVEISLSPIETEEGLLVSAAIRDVTEQKKLEERKVVERENELARLAELERFRKLIVGRELKMIELKKEIEDLKSKIPNV